MICPLYEKIIHELQRLSPVKANNYGTAIYTTLISVDLAQYVSYLSYDFWQEWYNRNLRLIKILSDFILLLPNASSQVSDTLVEMSNSYNNLSD